MGAVHSVQVSDSKQIASKPLFTELVSDAATAQRAYWRCIRVISVLHGHGSRSHTMVSWLCSVFAAGAERRAVSMVWPWGERVDTEVLTAVCTAEIIYAMAQVAADAPAALQREQ